jgi:MoaA/NifB/PqqE/SkfB family radical SAM enzyme
MDPYDHINSVIARERIKRLYGWLNGIPHPPLKLTAFITQKCNLKCKFCSVSRLTEEGRFDFSKELSTESWIKTTKEAINLGVYDWEVLGVGEALVRSDVVTKMIELVKRELPLSSFLLTTNGTLFSDEIIEKIVKEELTRIQFSIDGPDSKTHDYLRGVVGTFKSAISAISNITKMKRELDKRFPVLSINMVINAKNCDKITRMIDLASKIGVEEITLTPMRIVPEDADKIKKCNLIMSESQIRNFYIHTEEALKLSEKMGIKLSCLITRGKEMITKPTDDIIKEEFSNNFLSAPCYEPWLDMSIGPLGYVGPCVTSSTWGNKNLSVEKMSLKEIWLSREFEEIRKKRLNRIPLPQCSDCTVTEMRKRMREELIEYLKETGELHKYE